MNETARWVGTIALGVAIVSLTLWGYCYIGGCDAPPCDGFGCFQL